MTSELKCPFCQQELREIYFNGVGVGYICPNPNCKKAEKIKGNVEFWQALIQAKQDLETAKADIEDYKKYKALWGQIRNNTILELERKLEIATKALKGTKKVCDGCRWCDSNLYDPTPNDGRRIAETTNNTLEQIEHKE